MLPEGFSVQSHLEKHARISCMLFSKDVYTIYGKGSLGGGEV